MRRQQIIKDEAQRMKIELEEKRKRTVNLNQKKAFLLSRKPPEREAPKAKDVGIGNSVEREEEAKQRVLQRLRSKNDVELELKEKYNRPTVGQFNKARCMPVGRALPLLERLHTAEVEKLANYKK